MNNCREYRNYLQNFGLKKNLQNTIKRTTQFVKVTQISIKRKEKKKRRNNNISTNLKKLLKTNSTIRKLTNT